MNVVFDDGDTAGRARTNCGTWREYCSRCFNRHVWVVWDHIVRCEADRMGLSLRVRPLDDDADRD